MRVNRLKMGVPTRFAFWLMPRATDFYFQLINLWWVTLLITLPLSLVFVHDYGLGMFWVMGISMIFATLTPVVLILCACWAEIRTRNWEKENREL